MKRVLITGVIVLAVAVVAFLAGTLVDSALAQRGTGNQGGYGGGMMGGGGRGGGYGMMGGGPGNGLLHDYMLPALAEGLGLTADELQDRIDDGETPYDVAVSLGFTDEQIRDVFATAHAAALEAAVNDGVITQLQADRMNTRMQQRIENGFGPGRRDCPMWQNRPATP